MNPLGVSTEAILAFDVNPVSVKQQQKLANYIYKTATTLLSADKEDKEGLKQLIEKSRHLKLDELTEVKKDLITTIKKLNSLLYTAILENIEKVNESHYTYYNHVEMPEWMIEKEIALLDTEHAEKLAKHIPSIEIASAFNFRNHIISHVVNKLLEEQQLNVAQELATHMKGDLDGPRPGIQNRTLEAVKKAFASINTNSR